jgi:hypothetical protein
VADGESAHGDSGGRKLLPSWPCKKGRAGISISSSITMALNGNLLDTFSPSRGIRQGDPLSPFLFLFVADGLSTLLQREVDSNHITPVKICHRAPGILHLLFADNSLLFFKAQAEQATRIQSILCMPQALANS